MARVIEICSCDEYIEGYYADGVDDADELLAEWRSAVIAAIQDLRLPGVAVEFRDRLRDWGGSHASRLGFGVQTWTIFGTAETARITEALDRVETRIERRRLEYVAAQQTPAKPVLRMNPLDVWLLTLADGLDRRALNHPFDSGLAGGRVAVQSDHSVDDAWWAAFNGDAGMTPAEVEAALEADDRIAAYEHRQARYLAHDEDAPEGAELLYEPDEILMLLDGNQAEAGRVPMDSRRGGRRGPAPAKRRKGNNTT